MYDTMKITEEENEQLLSLSRQCDTGSSLFYVDRGTDFHSLSSELGEYHYYGVKRKGELIACIGVTKQFRKMQAGIKPIYYLHDVKVHPNYRHSRAFVHLIHEVKKTYSDVDWMFSTILSTHSSSRTVVDGRGFFPKGMVIGEMVHVGVPLFIGKQKRDIRVNVIDEQTAWSFYHVTAPLFSRMEYKAFTRKNGLFLGNYDTNGKLISICKLVDQSRERQLRATKQLPISYRLINPIVEMAGCPRLPKKDEPLQHCYLAYYVSNKEENREAFIQYVKEHYRHHYTYLFYGIKKQQANQIRSSKFNVSLQSQMIGYGDVPNVSVSNELIYI
ncbi:hypothetical protein [Alkalihalobacterium bogoriense]|uniref:hypothetical protein n=1 Tax=Alkalihalobacterium bogoriense TaxID=246272 RepID=UPI00047CF86A|nr:hypothetical protein [Alkalihalobacterium bogoriense]